MTLARLSLLLVLSAPACITTQTEPDSDPVDEAPETEGSAEPTTGCGLNYWDQGSGYCDAYYSCGNDFIEVGCDDENHCSCAADESLFVELTSTDSMNCESAFERCRDALVSPLPFEFACDETNDYSQGGACDLNQRCSRTVELEDTEAVFTDYRGLDCTDQSCRCYSLGFEHGVDVTFDEPVDTSDSCVEFLSQCDEQVLHNTTEDDSASCTTVDVTTSGEERCDFQVTCRQRGEVLGHPMRTSHNMFGQCELVEGEQWDCSCSLGNYLSAAAGSPQEACESAAALCVQ